MTIDKPSRITSIDLLRGIIMVVMAIDHCRDFFHYDAWVHNPTDFLFTTPPLFLTRWITHYCAPNFIFLAGISAYLYGQKPGRNLTRFLLTRGFWLIFLEFTVFKFLWMNEFATLRFFAMVIWAIGISMVFLALIHKLPYWLILTMGLLIVFLHNATDSYNPDINSTWGIIWSLLHRMGNITPMGLHVYILYPVLPYFGLISLGYCAGKLYTSSFTAQARKRTLILLGTGCLVLFVALRSFNIYGDASHWAPYTWLWSSTANYVFSILSFINTTKYPCSLLYILMTVGPALIFLGVAENIKNGIAQVFITIGKVPMFYYLFHLILIRIVLLALTTANHYTAPFNRYHLSTVYFVWMFVVLALYFPCKWYAGYKAAHPEKWWLSYL